MFIRGGSAPRSNPLPFYIPFFSKEVPLDVYAIFKILRCWLSLIFRVDQYLRRQERRKWTSKTFFFSCKTGVVRISLTVEMVGRLYYGKAKNPCQIFQGGPLVP